MCSLKRYEENSIPKLRLEGLALLNLVTSHSASVS